MNQRWFRSMFRRRFIIIALLLIQLSFLIHLISSGSHTFQFVNRSLTLLSLLTVLYIVSKKDKGAYKTTWVFLIMALPLFGGLLYLLFSFQNSTRRFAKKIKRAEKKAAPLFQLPGDAYVLAKQQLGNLFPQTRYLQDYMGFPIYSNSSVKYLSPGEKMYESMLSELKKAQNYIFLEFFIVQKGIMWDSILEILKEKAQQGVKIRLIYDDMGCFFLLPNDYPKQLKKDGIECVMFNPFRPLLTAKQNNRDHRKIISIDGKVAFTGGINLADEYINVIEKHGHWKDSGIMMQGKAAWSFTLMFLEM